jgi:hypothetical protein
MKSASGTFGGRLKSRLKIHNANIHIQSANQAPGFLLLFCSRMIFNGIFIFVSVIERNFDDNVYFYASLV